MYDSRPAGGEAIYREPLGASGLEGRLGTHSPIGVACTLLNKLLQLLPERPDTAALNEGSDVLREYPRSGTDGTDDHQASHGEIETPDVPESGSGLCRANAAEAAIRKETTT